MLLLNKEAMGENRKITRSRLVTNKLLHRCQQLHGHGSVSGVSETLGKRPLNGHKDTLVYSVFASTWNVGGVTPSDGLDLEDWLDTRANAYDIYVLGFQEIVPLNARNVLGPRKSRVSAKWNSLIGEALNRRCREEGGANTNSSAKDDEGSVSVEGSQGFRCIRSKQMVGIFTSVWARSSLRPLIRHLDASCIGSGIMGCLGNKGSVSIRFVLHDTSFCFVCCHLASGGKQGDVLLRNLDVADILARTRFPGLAAQELPEKILDHE